MEQIDFYKRIESRNHSVYVHPLKPDWFVPTARADYIFKNYQKKMDPAFYLSKYSEKFSLNRETSQLDLNNLISRIDTSEAVPYTGRENYRQIDSLKECWFHLSDKCNMACTHCMFSSSDSTRETIPLDILMQAVDDAYKLGCRIFYFTGGEPFIYPNFTGVCDSILYRKNTHVVILTNARIIEKFDGWLSVIPRERVHLQISIDGLEQNHDRIRGKGEFRRLLNNLSYLMRKDIAVTLAMAVTKDNYTQMDAIIDVADRQNSNTTRKIDNMHYMWLFQKGKAGKELFVEPALLFKHLAGAYEKGKKSGIRIDNMEALKSQVFSISGTRFDLSNSGWQSLAIGPDGSIYPSPALVHEPGVNAGNVSQGLEKVWRESRVLNDLRKATLLDDKKLDTDPLKFIVGGGDIDHSFIAGNHFTGSDPYMELYGSIVLYLIDEYASSSTISDGCGFLGNMGEYMHECDEDSAAVGFTHSNCVLSLPGKSGYYSIKSFYTDAAKIVKDDIVNPVGYEADEISHIPEASKVRSYGCGSPVMDCQLKKGEVLVDLGCGTGTECLIAAKKTGKKGRIIGIDMLDTMINIAEESARQAGKNLGYSNVEFHNAYLEDLPVDSSSVDIVISNCVINLTVDKRRTFSEIFRILKPGGRLVISDIVSSSSVPIEIQYNEKLRGECIGGAMREDALFSLLRDLRFEHSYIIKRFLYREVKNFPFYSITYSAHKPLAVQTRKVIYRGPFEGILLNNGQVIRKGVTSMVTLPDTIDTGDSLFLLDNQGNVTNIDQDARCSCFTAPEDTVATKDTKDTTTTASKNAEPALKPVQLTVNSKHAAGCMVCGVPLVYPATGKDETCYFCQKTGPANAVCKNGHFVCDTCHSAGGKKAIEEICLHTKEQDLIKLFKNIRKHPAIPMHGPDYHSLVPAVILTAYKNSGGKIENRDILTGIQRGSTIAGGACSFLGVCGAAAGVGIAFSIICRANPYLGEERQFIQQITGRVLSEIAKFKAPRCCQRDSWIAMQKTVELAEEFLDIALSATQELRCNQFAENRECIGDKCPIWPNNN